METIRKLIVVPKLTNIFSKKEIVPFILVLEVPLSLSGMNTQTPSATMV